MNNRFLRVADVRDNKLSVRDKVVVFTIFFALLCSFPYTFPRFFPIPELTIIMAVELVLLAFVSLTFKNKKPMPRPFIIMCLSQFVIFFFLFILHGDTFYLMRFALFVIIAFFSLFVVHNSLGIVRFVHINNIWLVV